MAEKRPLPGLAGMSPGVQLAAALLCMLLTFIILYPLFLLAGHLAGADTDVFYTATEGLEADINSLKYFQVAQHITLFIIPVLVWSYLSGGGIAGYTGMNRLPRPSHVVVVVVISVLLFPVNSYTAFLNSEMELPSWLSQAETWLQMKEEQGERLTGLMINSGSFPTLIINLVVLAIVPALGEELFFRGVLQKLLKAIIGWPHLTVFITAAIFSSLHFQFYGFLPRFILGIVYGYLFLWTGSVWLPVVAHFINNSVPVVLSYLYGWEEVAARTEQGSSDNPIFPVASIFAVIILMVYTGKIIRTWRKSQIT
jgi:uncharacterized protein